MFFNTPHFDLSWWIYFTVFVVIALIFDIKVLHKSNKPMPSKQAIVTTAAWVVIALLFTGLLYTTHGHDKALEFLTGYLIEESLSIDNLFVFLLIFQHFSVPERFRYRILMWGIVGALIMRFIFIFAGIALITAFHWIIYLFGAFLLFTGLSLFKKKETDTAFEKNILVSFLQKFMPISNEWNDGSFFERKNGRLFATPLFVVLLTIESTDLVFALDSIPAVFAVTLDPFIVYSCNVLAILGLRPLFFVLQDMLRYFTLLHYGVCIILMFVGLKMILSGIVAIPVLASLFVILSIVTGSLLLSLYTQRKG